jgi:flagellar biogenesis protein FliO
MLLAILIIAGKAQIPVTLTVGTGSIATSNDSLTKLTQGSTFVGLQVAMWMFIIGCVVWLAWIVRKIITTIRDKRKENKTNGN